MDFKIVVPKLTEKKLKYYRCKRKQDKQTFYDKGFRMTQVAGKTT